MKTKGDRALIFFGLAALACLLVSLPATLRAMELFHGQAGIAATLVFEIGAVGSELATLAIPQWRGRLLLLTITLLVLTTGGNYALGIDHFGSAQMDAGSTYATIRAAGAGWLLAIMSSAIFPALLLVFLTAFTARWRMMRGAAPAIEPTIINNTQIVNVLPENAPAFIAAWAAQLPSASPEELAERIGIGATSIRNVLESEATE